VSLAVSLRAILLVLLALLGVLRALLWWQKRRRAAASKGRGGFLCPECGAYRVVVARSILLPSEGDESGPTKLQAIACRRCTFRGVAVAARGRHTGYPLKPIDHAALVAEMERCPAPTHTGCDCPAHARYGGEGGLAAITRERREMFDLQRSAA
jgi:hypothetical protein